MLKIEISTGIWTFFFFLLIEHCIAVCPNGITRSCICEDNISGAIIICRELRISLNSLIALLKEIPIYRLTIIDSSWPVISRVPPFKIRSLGIVACSVNKIEDRAFSSLSETLEELVLANNSLVTFPVLGVLPRLQSLNLNNNKLKTVGDDAVRGISHLQHLRLEGNQITTISRTALIAAKLKLELLDLSGNSLTKVPSQVISNSGNLKYVDLSYNKLEYVANMDFRNLPNLIELRLSNNKIARIESLGFWKTAALRYLYLQKNLLTDVENVDFTNNFELLEILDLSSNILTKIPRIKGHLSLQQLKLDFNKLTFIEEASFSFNAALEVINLENNEIAAVAEKSFLAMDQLKVLLLGNNRIKYLDEKSLKGIKELQHLSLRNNSLVAVANETFRAVPKLKLLDLADNRLRRIPKNLFWYTPDLTWLDLSNNMLTGFEEGTFIPKIPNVKLVGNPVECNTKMERLLKYLNQSELCIYWKLGREISYGHPKHHGDNRSQNFTSEDKKFDVKNVKKIKPPSNLTHEIMASRNFDKNRILPKEMVIRPNTSLIEATEIVENARIPVSKISGLRVDNGSNEENSDNLKKNYGLKETNRTDSHVVTNRTSADNIALFSTEPSTQRLNMWQLLLPSDYDIRQIPKEVVQTLSKGEVPDFSEIPIDLKLHFLKNARKLFTEIVKEGAEATNALANLRRIVTVEKNEERIYHEPKVVDPLLKKNDSFGMKDYLWYSLLFALASLFSVITSTTLVIIFGVICVSKQSRNHSTAIENPRNEYAVTKSYLKSTPTAVPGPSLLQYSQCSPLSSSIYCSASSHFSSETDCPYGAESTKL